MIINRQSMHETKNWLRYKKIIPERIIGIPIDELWHKRSRPHKGTL